MTRTIGAVLVAGDAAAVVTAARAPAGAWVLR